jgi:hypothetical protein
MILAASRRLALMDARPRLATPNTAASTTRCVFLQRSRSVMLTACHNLVLLDAAVTNIATTHVGRDADGVFLRWLSWRPWQRLYSANRHGGCGFIRWGIYQSGLWIRRPAESWRSWPPRPCCKGAPNMAANTRGFWIRRPAECWCSWPPRPCGQRNANMAVNTRTRFPEICMRPTS